MDGRLKRARTLLHRRAVAPLLPCSPTPLRQIRPHGIDEANDRTQRRVIAQLQVVAARDIEGVADGLEGLGLLDGVDAQVGFHVQVKLQHLQRVAGLGGHDLQHLVSDGIDRRRLTADRGRNRGRGDWLRLSGGRRLVVGRRRRQIGPHGIDEADDRAEGRVVAQLQVVAAGDVEGVADGLEGLGLLDGVDTQVGLHVEVEFQHFQRIAGLGGHDLQHLVSDGIDRRRLTADRGRNRGRGDWLRLSAGRRLVVGRRCRQIGPHRIDEADDRAEGRVVAQLQVVAAGDVESVADGLEGLGLLDGVDAQVGLHVQVEVEHLQRVASLLGDNA